MLCFFLIRLPFFHPLLVGLKPAAGTLFDNAESRIAARKDHTDQGFGRTHGVVPLTLLPEALLPAARTGEFPTPAVRPLFSGLCCDLFASAFNLRLPHWKQALEMADYAGFKADVTPGRLVQVSLVESDGKDEVVVE